MLPCLCSRKSLSSISSMLCQSLRTSLVFLDLAINSFLSRTILVFNSIPLHPPFNPFSSVVSTLYLSRYPQCLLYHIVDTLQSVPSSLPSSFPHSRRQFRQFLSTRLRQCTLVLRPYYF